jgi:hypothetical protein
VFIIASIGWIDTNPSVVTTGPIIDSETYGLTLIERQDIDTTTSCVIRILQRLAILLNLVQRDVVPARVAVPAIIRVISPRRVAAALAIMALARVVVEVSHLHPVAPLHGAPLIFPWVEGPASHERFRFIERQKPPPHLGGVRLGVGVGEPRARLVVRDTDVRGIPRGLRSLNTSRNVELTAWPIVSIIVTTAEKSSATGLCKECPIFWCTSASVIPNLLTQRLFICTKTSYSYTDYIAS